MARVKRAVNALKKRRKVFKLSKGYFGGRKLKKREYRRLWIARINAAARMNGISYSRLMNGLKVAGVNVNRKMLSELAINDAKAFTALVEKAKAAK